MKTLSKESVAEILVFSGFALLVAIGAKYLTQQSPVVHRSHTGASILIKNLHLDLLTVLVIWPSNGSLLVTGLTKLSAKFLRTDLARITRITIQ